MEFFISREILRRELEFVQGIVEKKSTIPVLSNLLIKSDGVDKIRITGTDLDITIQCAAPARVEKPGAICIPSKKLFDIVRLLPDAEIHFAADSNAWANLKSGKAKFRIAGVGHDNFPDVPQFRNAPLQLPVAVFNSFIQRTNYAITQEQSRFTLSGAKFIIKGGTAIMVATDGHRLAYAEESVALRAEIDVLIPKKALSELLKISRDSAGSVSFGEDANHVYFDVDGRLLIARKLTGTFPNYEMVIPKNNDKSVQFDAEELKKAIRRVSLMADERTRSVKLTLKPNEIEIGAQSSEEGEANESISADYAGEEIPIGFNSQYVQDFLNSVTTGDAPSESENEEDAGENGKPKKNLCVMKFRDANGQVQFQQAGSRFFSIIMPLRI